MPTATRKKRLPSKKTSSGHGRYGLTGAVCVFVLGVVMGGWLFADVQPRALLSVRHCDQCLAPNDLLGLVAAVGIQKVGSWLPFVVQETAYTLVIRNPFPDTRVDFVVIPKKDIKDAGRLSRDDQAYLIDAFAVMSRIIRERHLGTYQILSNGPGWQKVTYLHFHLMSWEPGT